MSNEQRDCLLAMSIWPSSVLPTNTASPTRVAEIACEEQCVHDSMTCDTGKSSACSLVLFKKSSWGVISSTTNLSFTACGTGMSSVCSLVHFRIALLGFRTQHPLFFACKPIKFACFVCTMLHKLRLQLRAKLRCPSSGPRSCSQQAVHTLEARRPHMTVLHAQRPNCSQKKNARTLQEQDQTPKLWQFDCRFLCAVQSEV